MTTKEWLMRGWEINKEINALLEEKERAFSRACSVTAPTDREHVTTTRRNTFEEKTVRYADYEKKIDRRIDELLNDCTLRKLLIKRYLQFKTWEQIAVEMNYSYMHITRLHGKALQKVKMLQNVILILWYSVNVENRIIPVQEGRTQDLGGASFLQRKFYGGAKYRADVSWGGGLRYILYAMKKQGSFPCLF